MNKQRRPESIITTYLWLQKIADQRTNGHASHQAQVNISFTQGAIELQKNGFPDANAQCQHQQPRIEVGKASSASAKQEIRREQNGIKNTQRTEEEEE
jgi:hypothetical protein